MKWTVALTALTLLLSGGAALSAPSTGQPNAARNAGAIPQSAAPAAPAAAAVTKAAAPIDIPGGDTPDELLPLKPGTKVLPPPRISKQKVEMFKQRALQMTPPTPRQLTQEEKDRATRAQAVRMQEGLKHVAELKQETLREEMLRHPPKPPGLVLKSQQIANGYMSGITDTQQLCFRDHDSFVAFWRKHDRARSVPNIDFKKQMVIAVFSGPKKTMGHHVYIRRVALVNDVINVTLEETNPEGANVTQAQMITQPYDIVVVDKYDYPVIFSPNLANPTSAGAAASAPGPTGAPAVPAAARVLAK